MKFTGITANKGQVQGPLCIINNQDQFDHCTSENIVLLNKVKPNVALVKKVKGVLAVHGGITSHAAITARENNKPAIVGLSEEILTKFKEGDVVNLDGDNGSVYLSK